MSNINWRPFAEVTVAAVFLFAIPFAYGQKRETVVHYGNQAYSAVFGISEAQYTRAKEAQ